MIDEIRDHTGEIRKLLYQRTDGGTALMGLPRAARTNIQTLRSNAGLKPLIQPGDPEWREVDFVTGAPGELITDQKQYGACTAFSAAGAMARMRFWRGMPWVPLSGFWLYDQINGGKDRGSNIIDSMGVVENKGIPPLSSYMDCKFQSDQNPSGVEWYTEDVAVTCGSAIEAANIILRGGMAQAPILVTNQFENFTGDGVAFGGGAPRSSSSNHSIYLAGIKFLNGDPKNWVFILVNSWRLAWGPFKNGTCLIIPDVIDNAENADDGYGHVSSPTGNAPTNTERVPSIAA